MITNAQRLRNWYKKNHIKGDLCCITLRFDMLNVKHCEITTYYIRGWTDLENICRIYGESLSYKYDSVSSEVIDCYFTTEKEENYKRKFILKRGNEQ